MRHVFISNKWLVAMFQTVQTALDKDVIIMKTQPLTHASIFWLIFLQTS